MRFQIHNADLRIARDLRKGMTDAERVVWAMLRARRLRHWKFRRQYRVERYVLDFYAPLLRLAIELDGAVHFTEEARRADALRDAFLSEKGIRVLRFENREVIANPGHVLREIERFARGEIAAPHP
jgi:very-short-patch-repair endonuclease